EVREKYPDGVGVRYTLSKQMYVNPEQAKDYHIALEQEVSLQKIKEFRTSDYNRPDRFRLKLTSDSEDARYYEMLDSMKAYYNGMNIHLIGDSIQKYMDSLPQGNSAVENLASET